MSAAGPAPGASWLWAAARRHLVAILLVLVVALIVLAYAFPGGQIYLVEARTLGATVTVGDAEGRWRLPPSTLCARRDRVSPQAGAGWDGTGCNPALFETRPLDTVEIALPKGTGIEARIDAEGGLTLRLLAPAPATPIALTDAVDWTPGSLLIVARDDWRGAGALKFSGHVVIGEVVEVGSAAYLLDGRYEIRERLLRQRLPFGETEPVEVAQGTLFRGDRVEFRTRSAKDGEIVARGFVAPTYADDEGGFLVMAASDPDAVGADFLVRSFGAGPTIIRPNWTDRATRDPVFLALSAILGIAIGCLALIFQAYQTGERSAPPPPAPPRPPAGKTTRGRPKPP